MFVWHSGCGHLHSPFKRNSYSHLIAFYGQFKIGYVLVLVWLILLLDRMNFHQISSAVELSGMSLVSESSSTSWSRFSRTSETSFSTSSPSSSELENKTQAVYHAILWWLSLYWWYMRLVQGDLFYTFSEYRRAPGSHFAWVSGYSLEFFPKQFEFPEIINFLYKYWR